MKVLRSTRELKDWRDSIAAESSVGFVPTMGALHVGHTSLLDRARLENDYVVLSIFVNPTQFNQASDFEKYPKTMESDLSIAEKARVDAVFSPADPSEMYPNGYRFEVREKDFSKKLCGEYRPGHFEGVLTVVMKLLNLVRAKSAYFGEKDYQQLSLIRDMAEDFFIQTEIIGCPTIRESSGLALSSRNMRLSSAGQLKAASIYRVLTGTKKLEEAKKELIAEGFEVEYLEEFRGRRFIAAWIEGVRLIDNVPIAETQSVSLSREVSL